MKTLALLLLTLCLYHTPCLANEALNFKTPTSYKDKLVITSLQKQFGGKAHAYLLAKSDLNNDSIDEYIAKPSDNKFCKAINFCPHYIIALPQYQPRLIAHFDAYTINISYKDSYGVRNLWVYNNQHNNFAYATAQWNPLSSQYEEVEKKK